MAINRQWISKYLTFVSFGMIGFPILFPLFSGLVFKLGWKGIAEIALSPTFYVASTLWILTGTGIIAIKKWSWYTFMAAETITFYYNCLLLVNYSQSDSKGFALVFALLIQFYMYLLCRRQLIVPYLFPKIRWWEFGIAGMNHIPITIWSRPAATTPGQVLDFSTRGCFVKSPGDFETFEPVSIEGDYKGMHFKYEGVVLWVASSTVTHPKGIGVRFLDLDRHDRKMLKEIAEQFEKESQSGIIILDA